MSSGKEQAASEASPGSESQLSTSLLERVKAREPEAWGRLSKLYGPLVYKWCLGAGLQPQDAADVVQEVFRRIVTAMDGFRRERPGDSFRGWLWTITRNKIRDHIRRTAKYEAAEGGTDAQQQLSQVPDIPLEESSDSIADHPEAVISHAALLQIKAHFEEKTWQAFWRTTVEEQKPVDVAADLGMNVSAVYMAKSRVFRRVRDELRGLVE